MDLKNYLFQILNLVFAAFACLLLKSQLLESKPVIMNLNSTNHAKQQKLKDFVKIIDNAAFVPTYLNTMVKYAMSEKLKSGAVKKMKKINNSKSTRKQKQRKIPICILSTTISTPISTPIQIFSSPAPRASLNGFISGINTPFTSKNWGNI